MRGIAILCLVLALSGCAKDRDAATEKYWSRRESSAYLSAITSYRSPLRSPQSMNPRDRGYPNSQPIPELGGRR
jgi:hypothetical protein